MSEVSGITQSAQLPAVTKKYPVQKKAPVIIETAPDTVEISKKAKPEKKPFSWGRTFIAGAAGAFAGKQVYEKGKVFVEKGINYAEKEIGAFEKEFGRDVINFPDKGKAIAKYGLPALAGLAVAGIIIKDADNDGKSDLGEAIKTFINPGGGMY